VVLNEPIRALAHLGLGRAYALSGDTVKAKSAYQDFLTLWKDADPDILNSGASQNRVREAEVVTGSIQPQCAIGRPDCRG